MPLLRLDVLLLVVIAVLVLIWSQRSAWVARCIRKYRLGIKKLRRQMLHGKHK